MVMMSIMLVENVVIDSAILVLKLLVKILESLMD